MPISAPSRPSGSIVSFNSSSAARNCRKQGRLRELSFLRKADGAVDRSGPLMIASHNADEDARFMAVALTLGRRGLGRTWPNPTVGAVGAKMGSLWAEGGSSPGGGPQPQTT